MFRNCHAIHLLLQELQRQCSDIHREYGYLIPPDVVKQGNEIRAEMPIWIEGPECPHIKCPKAKCNDCFLFHIEDAFHQIMDRLVRDGIPLKDILVIMNSSALTKNSPSNCEYEFLGQKYPELDFKSNFEFD